MSNIDYNLKNKLDNIQYALNGGNLVYADQLACEVCRQLNPNVFPQVGMGFQTLVLLMFRQQIGY
jgi:hypothetical protein